MRVYINATSTPNPKNGTRRLSAAFAGFIAPQMTGFDELLQFLMPEPAIVRSDLCCIAMAVRPNVCEEHDKA